MLILMLNIIILIGTFASFIINFGVSVRGPNEYYKYHIDKYWEAIQSNIHRNYGDALKI